MEENAEQDPPELLEVSGPKVSAFKSKFPTPLHPPPWWGVTASSLPVPPKPTQPEVEESIVVPVPKASQLQRLLKYQR